VPSIDIRHFDGEISEVQNVPDGGEGRDQALARLPGRLALAFLRGPVLHPLRDRAVDLGGDLPVQIDWDLFCIDGSSIRASRDAAGASPTDGTSAEPADHALGRSRGGYGSKIHLVCDGQGLPMAVSVTAGQRHESTQVEAVMGSVRVAVPVGRPRRRPRKLAGDKGYSYRRVRRYLRRRGIKAVIPTRKDQKRIPTFDKPTYRRRNVVERCIGWLKDRRRLATRFEKLAENFLAMVKLAMLERLLKALLPDTA
jgi:transposase